MHAEKNGFHQSAAVGECLVIHRLLAFHNLLAVPRQAMPPMTDSAMSMLIAAIHILRREPCNLSGSALVLESGSNSTCGVSSDLQSKIYMCMLRIVSAYLHWIPAINGFLIQIQDFYKKLIDVHDELS